jgi:hypothetical protein
VYAALILILKLFICMSFGTIYVVHLELFDSTFLNKSYGICNIVTRIFVLGEPIIAEMEGLNAQLLIMLAINLLAFISTMFLKRSS